MKRLLLLAALAAMAAACGPKYETVEGDPLQAKIYTLKNGINTPENTLFPSEEACVEHYKALFASM